MWELSPNVRRELPHFAYRLSGDRIHSATVRVQSA